MYIQLYCDYIYYYLLYSTYFWCRSIDCPYSGWSKLYEFDAKQRDGLVTIERPMNVAVSGAGVSKPVT